MEFQILGPLVVRDGDRVVELPRQKQRALLACLLLRPGEPASIDRLIEDLWGDSVPATARASLQNLVSQLRRALGPETLVTREGGYVLEVGPEDVDLTRFERLVRDSRREAGHERAATLHRALALWRGQPLAGLAFEPFAAPEVARLEELLLRVQEELIEVELGLGRHDDGELLARIEALAAANPLRERLHGQLMLALYRADRQAEALEAFRELRHRLVEELGIEPSPDVRELEGAILRHDPALAPAAAPRETRARATVLCALLAEPDARALAEARAAAEYHGGSIGRAARGELVAVFTGHEDDALRAARAALQMRRALEPLGVGVRAAAATGALVLAGGRVLSDAAGRPVALAVRLAAAAAPGELLVDEATAGAAGGSVATEPAGRDSALRLLDASVGPAMRPGGAAPLIGRAVELERLRAAFAEARTERACRVVVLAGEAGIGKSRLAAEFAHTLGDRASVLVGRCVSYGEGATWLPLAEIVAQAVGDDPRAAIERRLAGDEYAAVVAEQVAELVGRAPGGGSTGEPFWAVRRLLEALAAERPLLLVLDDLHWAEPTFLDLVEYLRQWSHDAPLLVVGLARPELVDRRAAWAAGAIALPRLTDEHVRELVAAIAGGLAPAGQARVVELADGNPLFAEQLVAHAAEGPDALDRVPPSLEALISSRLDRLDPGERAVLERAAVVGREFWHGAVLHLANPLDVPSVGRHLLELVRKGLIRPGRPLFPREDGFRFHHVLIRDVAYEAVPAGSRADLHERVAGWLDSQSPEQDELVGYHLEQAYRSRTEVEPSDPSARGLAAAAGDRLARAGLRAARRGDPAAAANLLARAAALLPAHEAAHRDLLAELGLALWKTGELERAEEVLDEAATAAARARDRRAELRALVELASLRLNRDPEGGADELLALASTAIPAFEQAGDDRALGRVWFATATVHGSLHCRYAAAERAALEALVHYRRSGWPQSACLQELAAALFFGPAPVDEAIRSCREMLEEADLGAEASVSIFLAGLEAMRGGLDDARAFAFRSRALYESLGWTEPLRTTYAALAGVVELLAGEPAAAEPILADSCSALAAWGESGHLATQAALLGEALYRQGRHEEAAVWARTAEEHAASDDASAQFSWRALRAKVLARHGELDEAVACAREAARLAGATDALNQSGEVLLDLAEVLLLAGREDEASAEIDAARDAFERKGNTVSAERAGRLRAELAAT